MARKTTILEWFIECMYPAKNGHVVLQTYKYHIDALIDGLKVIRDAELVIEDYIDEDGKLDAAAAFTAAGKGLSNRLKAMPPIQIAPGVEAPNLHGGFAMKEAYNDSMDVLENFRKTLDRFVERVKNSSSLQDICECDECAKERGGEPAEERTFESVLDEMINGERPDDDKMKMRVYKDGEEILADDDVPPEVREAVEELMKKLGLDKNEDDNKPTIQ